MLLPALEAPTDLSDPAVLAANEQGTATPRQRRTLRSWIVRRAIAPVGWLVLALAISLFLLLRARGLAVIFTEPDPLRYAAHLRQFTVNLPVLRIVVSVLVLSWALALLRAISPLPGLAHAWFGLVRGRIVAVEGIVVPSDEMTIAFAVTANGTIQCWNVSTASGCEPGIYRFLFLPRRYLPRAYESDSGWLLSARRLDEDDDPAATTRSEQERGLALLRRILAAANGFRLDALPMNQLGLLEDKQRRVLTRAHRRHVLSLVVAGAVLLALSGGLGARQLRHGGIAVAWELLQHNTQDALFLLLLGGIGLVLIVIAFWPSERQDLAEGRVTMAEGIVHKTVRQARRSGVSGDYVYQLGSLQFEVPNRAAYDALVDGGAYRLYYLPRSEVLVNVEPVAPARPEGD